jgi:hypothetical protein
VTQPATRLAIRQTYDDLQNPQPYQASFFESPVLLSYFFQSASSSENCIPIFAFIRIENLAGQHNNGGAMGYRCGCRSPDGNVPFGFADSDVIPGESLQVVILFDMAGSRSLSTVPMG